MVPTKDESLQNYKKFQLKLSREDFARQFDHPFLVFDKEESTEQADQHIFDTKRVQPDQIENLMKESLLKTVSSKVIKLVKKGANNFKGKIYVGRVSNCDVVIDNPAVSKFHAYFAKDPKTNTCYIVDADSMNGTFINDNKAKPNQHTDIYDGDTISFGRQIIVSFYTPEGCYDLLQQISD